MEVSSYTTRPATKSTSARYIFWLFFSTRLLLVVVTYIAYVLFTVAKPYSSTPVDAGLFSSWNQWDAQRYTHIAQNGYLPADVVFFPLLPFLISCIARVLGSWSYIPVGMLISNLVLLGTLFLLYKLLLEDVEEETVQRTLLYLCIFPTALFFFAAYNESLYLFFTVATFFALHRQRWWLAGCLGLFAALTRSAGILLVVPYLYELWTQRATLFPTQATQSSSLEQELERGKPAPYAPIVSSLKDRHDVWQSITSVTFSLYTMVKINYRQLLPVVLIPLGTAIFALYCWMTVGSPLAFITEQGDHGRHLTWPWVGILQTVYKLLFTQGFGSSNQAHLLLDLSATLGCIALIVLGWHRIRRSYSIWMAVVMLYLLLDPATDKANPLLSQQRFVLEFFPAFLTLALLTRKAPRLHTALQVVFPTLLAVLSIGFLLGRWVV